MNTVDDIQAGLLLENSFAFDIETTGLDPWSDKPVMLQVAREDGTVFLMDLREEDPIVLKDYFENPDIVKIVHNSSFDCTWLKVHYDIDTYNIWDTRIAETVILGVSMPRQLKKADKEWLMPQYSASLKYCLNRRGLEPKMEFEAFHYDKPFTEHQLKYAANDVRYLHRLYMDQSREETPVLKVEMKLCEVTYQMRARGFTFNKSKWLKFAESNKKDYDSIMAHMPSDVDNWQSEKQVKEYFADQGIRIFSLTDLGKDFEGKHPVLDNFMRLRKVYKNVTTYGETWIKKFVRKNGTVHCDYTQVINTGRFSCSNPNLQQIPSDTIHRECFVPSKGNVFLISDFSGQELAIMAVGSGQEDWLEIIRGGGDLHQATADKIGVPRPVAKTINFAMAYGAGVPRIADTAGISETEAASAVNGWKRTNSRLYNWLKLNGRQAVAENASYSFLGRYRRLGYMGEEEWRIRNQGMNNPVQSTGADMIKLSMLHLYKFHRQVKIIHCLHDELVCEIKEDLAEQGLKWLNESMSWACSKILGEPLSRPDSKIAYNWKK